MEVTGVKLDTVALKQSSEELTAALNNLEKEISIPANRWAKSVSNISRSKRKPKRQKQAVTVRAKIFWKKCVPNTRW